MKAIVLYINNLDRDQHRKLNSLGWDSEIGRAYLGLQDEWNEYVARSFDLVETAAHVEADNAEQVFVAMQNHEEPWTDLDNNSVVKSISTDFPRSMSVGDLIVWEDGRRERVEACGFATL